MTRFLKQNKISDARETPSYRGRETEREMLKIEEKSFFISSLLSVTLTSFLFPAARRGGNVGTEFDLLEQVLASSPLRPYDFQKG